MNKDESMPVNVWYETSTNITKLKCVFNILLFNQKFLKIKL